MILSMLFETEKEGKKKEEILCFYISDLGQSGGNNRREIQKNAFSPKIVSDNVPRFEYVLASLGANHT